MNTDPSGMKSDALSYTELRYAIGIIGMALPFVLSLGAKLIFNLGVQSSISYYYHTPMRDVYVGALWVVGFFLLSYHGPYGRNSVEDWAGNLACVFAVCATLFPTSATDTPPPGQGQCSTFVLLSLLFFLLTLGLTGFFLYRFVPKHPGYKLKGSKKSPSKGRNYNHWMLGFCVLLMGLYKLVPKDSPWIVQLHYFFSVLFMFILAFFALVLFPQPHPVPEHPGDEPTPSEIRRNRCRNGLYILCGWIIVGCMVLIVIYELFWSNNKNSPITYWLETSMVFSFGVSWWVKGGGLRWLIDRKA